MTLVWLGLAGLLVVLVAVAVVVRGVAQDLEEAEREPVAEPRPPQTRADRDLGSGPRVTPRPRRRL